MSCRPTRAEIDAVIWLNNSPIPADVCAREPSLNDYGFYRRLNDGTFEFISFCHPDAHLWVAMHKDDFIKLLDKYVPNEKWKGMVDQKRLELELHSKTRLQ